MSADNVASRRRAFQENEKIRQTIDSNLGRRLVLTPDIEAECGISRSQGERKGKALAALDFFNGKSHVEIPARVADIVREAYRI